MAPDGHRCAISTISSTGIASGWIHGPFTLARKTFGAPVTQKRAWMQRRPSNSTSILVVRTVSPPFTTVLWEAPAAAAREAAESSSALLAAGAAGAVGAPASLWLKSKPRTARAYRYAN